MTIEDDEQFQAYHSQKKKKMRSYDNRGVKWDNAAEK